MNERAEELHRRLVRNVDDTPKQRETRAPLYDSLTARLAPGTPASKLGISIDIVAPGMRACPYHFHYAREEAFVILEGEGTLRIAGEMVAVRTGDTIFVPAGPRYPHQLINTSAAPLKYLSISTTDTPEIVEYPDSGKYLAMARGAEGSPAFDRIHRAEHDLDYWDGEP